MNKPWINNMLDVTTMSVYVNEDMDMVKNYIERYGESSYQQGRAEAIDEFLICLWIVLEHTILMDTSLTEKVIF